MQRAQFILTFCLLAAMPGATAFAANDASADTAIISCGNGIPGGVNCVPSRKDVKEALNAYNHGRKLKDHSHLEEAFEQFDQASRLVPRDALFLSAREMTKAQLVFQHTE